MNRYFIISIVLLSLFISSCASTLPRRKVAMPWSRVLASEKVLPVGANLSIFVDGQAAPLMGSEELTSGQIQDIAWQLMERRGFNVSGDSSQYVMRIHYKTEKEVKNVTIKNTTTNNYETTNYEPRPHSHHSNGGSHSDDSNLTTAVGIGLGVLLAVALVASLDDSDTATDSSTQYETETFKHTLAIDIFDQSKKLVWKADVNWSSPDVDIIKQTSNAFQTVFSSLPADDRIIPNVQKLKEAKYQDFIDSKIARKSFHCPAVPYKIRFDAFLSTTNDHYIVRNMLDRYAAPAYLDLLQSAEYAVPGVKDEAWANPKYRKIWRDITLGGKYTLGEDNTPVNVLISLKSNAYGYVVTKCSLVSDTEYEAFLSRLAKWKQTLQDYYDFYDK